jgi:hypothetical protein
LPNTPQPVPMPRISPDKSIFDDIDVEMNDREC